jgi:hypothetical protein
MFLIRLMVLSIGPATRSIANSILRPGNEPACMHAPKDGKGRMAPQSVERAADAGRQTIERMNMSAGRRLDRGEQLVGDFLSDREHEIAGRGDVIKKRRVRDAGAVIPRMVRRR